VLDSYWSKAATNGKPAAVSSLAVLAREQLRPHWKRLRPLVQKWLNVPIPQDPVMRGALTGYVRRESLLLLTRQILQDSAKGKSLDPETYQRKLEKLNFSFLDDEDKMITFTSSPVTYTRELVRGRVPTGIGTIDSRIRGGLGPGELGVVLSPPKGGKTATLVNFGTHAALLGKRVLHVTLEISKFMVTERYDMRIGGLSTEEIQASKKGTLLAIRKHVQDTGGEILIVDLSSESVTPDRIQNLIALHGPIGLVILDYADLMVSYTSEDRRAVLGQNYRDLRKVGVRMDVPTWTASQGTRDTIESEEFGLQNMAEDITKSHTADVVICMMQSPEQRQREIMRAKVAATRGSAENPIAMLRCQFKTMTITPMEGGSNAPKVQPKKMRRSRGRDPKADAQ
jgi:KaiC/GvpD/RAD55 family RecA-like ATPase